jgi:hypothetical protein
LVGKLGIFDDINDEWHRRLSVPSPVQSYGNTKIVSFAKLPAVVFASRVAAAGDVDEEGDRNGEPQGKRDF